MMAHSLRLAAFVAMSLLCSCGLSNDSLQFDDPALNQNIARIRAVAHEADLIFVGTVQAVGPAQASASGTAEVRQAVTYSVDSVLRGFYDQPEIDVDHLVVAGSRQTDPNGLSSQIFAPGAKLIVLVQRQDLFFADRDEDFSAIPHSDRNELALILNM